MSVTTGDPYNDQATTGGAQTSSVSTPDLEPFEPEVTSSQDVTPTGVNPTTFFPTTFQTQTGVDEVEQIGTEDGSIQAGGAAALGSLVLVGTAAIGVAKLMKKAREPSRRDLAPEENIEMQPLVQPHTIEEEPTFLTFQPETSSTAEGNPKLSLHITGIFKCRTLPVLATAERHI